MQKPLYKRLVLKLSGEALGGKSGKGYDWDVIDGLAVAIGKLRHMGIKVAVVTGGGNILRGRELDKHRLGRNAADSMGMLATVMNGIALREAFERNGLPTRLLTALHVPQVAQPYDPFIANKIMDAGEVIILSGGTGHPYFSTDTGAALRAAELRAEVLLKATNVPGVFDCDPRRFTTAQLFSFLSYQEVIDRELGVMDLTAVTICKENNIIIRVFDFHNPSALVDVCTDRDLGTTIGSKQKQGGFHDR